MVPPVDACINIGADALHRGIFKIGLGFGFRTIQPHVLCWTLHVHDANAIAVGPSKILRTVLIVVYTSHFFLCVRFTAEIRDQEGLGQESGAWKCVSLHAAEVARTSGEV